jgi:type II secretory pathway pseudopilin PulG
VVKRLQRLRGLLRSEGGFGLIELGIAMVILNIGILAIVAAFNSAGLALRRASAVANAGAIADTYIERYRGYRNCQISLDPAGTGGAIPSTGTYAADPAYAAAQIQRSSTASGTLPASCPMDSGGWPGGMTTDQQAAVTAHTVTYTGPDGRTYIVDVYIKSVTVNGGGQQKQVTIVVRDPANSTRFLARQSSTFDPFDAP